MCFDVSNISANNDRTGYNNQTSSYNGGKLQLKDMVAIRLGFLPPSSNLPTMVWFPSSSLSCARLPRISGASWKTTTQTHPNTDISQKDTQSNATIPGNPIQVKMQRIERQMQGYPDMLSSLYVRLRKVTNVFREPLWAETQTSVLQQIYPVVLPTTLSNLKLIFPPCHAQQA